MTVELISVGTEILMGNIVNSNTQFLAEKCAMLGFDLFFQVTVGDNYDRMMSVVRQGLSRSDILILTGGLGPTEDDLTKEVCADAFGMDFVQSYIGLESGRVGEDFTASVVVEEGLDAKSIMIPSMIVQIPVENAIKHGLAGKDGTKELTIRISRDGKGVRIVICDNGRGYLPQVASSTRGTGTGLKVLYQTIQLLNTKNKNEKIHFNIGNRNDGQTGTQVSVYIPFHFSYDL